MPDPAHAPGVGGLLGRMALFVALGIPLVAYLWETLNQVLAAHLDPVRLLVTVPVVLLLGALLVWVARAVRRIDAG